MITSTPEFSATARSRQLLQSAQKLEAAFLSQMLKSAGLGEFKDSFSGGAGEEHFASFLRDEQAKAIVRSGGIGLTEQLYASLMKAENE